MNMVKENWIGIIGLIGLCAGIPMSSGIVQNVLNVVGIASLILYAKSKKNDFFFYLESVVLFGTLLKIANVSSVILITALMIAAGLALVKVFQNPDYRKLDTIFGLIGLVGLVYGYATLSNYGYAVGGIASVIYSLIGYRKGLKSGLIFALLNLIYSALAIFMIVSH